MICVVSTGKDSYMPTQKGFPVSYTEDTDILNSLRRLLSRFLLLLTISFCALYVFQCERKLLAFDTATVRKWLSDFKDELSEIKFLPVTVKHQN